MAERPPQAVQDTWGAWVGGTLGGGPAQMEAATEAAIAAVAARASQHVIVRAAEPAWRECCEPIWQSGAPDVWHTHRRPPTGELP